MREGNLTGMGEKVHEHFKEELIYITGEITTAISSNLSSDTGKIFTVFLATIERFISFHHACIALIGNNGGRVKLLLSNEYKEIKFDSSIYIPPEGTVSGWVISNKKPFFAGELKRDIFPASAVMESSRNQNSCIAVPVYSNNNFIGSFTLWNEEKNKYREKDLLILEYLSGFLSIAIESSRLYREAKESEAELAALVQIGETLSSTMDLDVLSRTVIEELDRVISFPYAGLYLYDEDSGNLTLVDAKGVEGEERRISQEELMNRHPGWVIKNKATLHVNDVSCDERVRFPLTSDYEIPSSLCYVPMLYQGKCYGIIGLAGMKKNYFTSDHVRLVTAVAKQVAIAFSRAHLYQKEKEMVCKLQDANKLKDEYIANVSHELRTPLTAIIGFSYLLKGGRLGAISPVQLELIEDILTSSQNMLHLVEDLLDLSKLQAKKINLNKKETDLKVIVQEVITTARVMAELVEVSLETYFDKSFPLLFVDPDRLRQVILNLVTNAIKFNKEGGYVRIYLKDETECLLIKVSDSGVGIKPEDQSAVFEQFRQVEGSGTRRFRGTGLGLSISRRLIELHGGSILLDSEVGRGSTFTIVLPKDQVNIKEHTDNLPSITVGLEESIVDEKVEEKEKRSVLLVEDDKSIRKMVEFLFKDEFNFIFARDGIEGLGQTLRYMPDLILMDLALPNMDGYETTKIIKSIERTNNIPIIAFTARITEEDMDKVALCSFDKIINKPFDPTRLVGEIREFLSKRSQA